MGLFKKNRNPIDQRLNELNRQIAELEAQARKQRREEEARRAAEAQSQAASNGQEQSTPSAPEEPAPQKSTPRPRFRTTVTPKGVAPIHGIEPHEVDFFARKGKPVDFSAEPGSGSTPTPAEGKKDSGLLGKGQYAGHGFLAGLLALFGRHKPPPQSERLAKVLSTGSFQQMKPLRREKRIMRNRFIILAIMIFVVLFVAVRCVTR